MLLLVGLATPAWALDVASYRQLAEPDDGTSGQELAFARIALKGYLSGLAETLQMQRAGNEGAIYFLTRPKVCMPHDTPISEELVREVIDDEITDYADYYEEHIGGEWEEKSLAVFALYGLARRYPCQNGRVE